MKDPIPPKGYELIREGRLPKGKGECMKLFFDGKWHDSDGSLGGRNAKSLHSSWFAARPIAASEEEKKGGE